MALGGLGASPPSLSASADARERALNAPGSGAGGPAEVKAVLLDGMGTLVALAPPWESFAAGLWREHRIELSQGEAEWAFRAEMEYYRAHHLEGHNMAALLDLRGRCAEVLRAALPLRMSVALSPRELTEAMLGALRFSAYPEALATLAVLRARGVRLVAVSNWDISLAPILRGLGLERMLDAVITSAQVGRPKPAPEIFQAALSRVGVGAGQAVHVGDDPQLDVEGARGAGVRPVLLRRDPAGPDPAGPQAIAVGRQEASAVASSGIGGSGEAQAGIAIITTLAELPGLLT